MTINLDKHCDPELIRGLRVLAKHIELEEDHEIVRKIVADLYMNTGPESATIKTIYGGKKIVKSRSTNESYLAFDKDEIEYEKMILQSFINSIAFQDSSINMKLWVKQKIEVINQFLSEHYQNA